MLRMTVFVRRAEGLTHEEFLHHWRTVLGPLIAGTPGLAQHIVRYEQLDLTFQSALVLQVQGLSGAAGGYRAPFTAMWTTSPAS